MGNRRLADSMSTKSGPENNVIWELGVTELNLWQICHRIINLWQIWNRLLICVNLVTLLAPKVEKQRPKQRFFTSGGSIGHFELIYMC